MYLLALVVLKRANLERLGRDEYRSFRKFNQNMNIADQLINKLKELKKDNSDSSYPHIKNILKNQKIHIAFYEFKPFKLIRYRRHNNDEIFFHNVDDLSYRKDILDIKHFGRANEPGQGFFYCNDNENQATGMSEAMSIFRGNENSQEEILTISAWEIKENLKLAIILPPDGIKGNNRGFDEMKEFYKMHEDTPEYHDLVIFNEFLSLEFSLEQDKDESNYKITCAFANYIKEEYKDVDGIIYSSIKSEFQGTNIVLWPDVVNRKLEFLMARKQIIKKVNEKRFVETQKFDSIGFHIKTGEIVWE